MQRERSQAAKTARIRVQMRGDRDGAARSRDEGSVMELDRRGCFVQPRPWANRQREEPVDEAKPFNIPKRVVWKAFKRVKANRGAAGVDKQSIAEFEADLSNNLYTLESDVLRELLSSAGAASGDSEGGRRHAPVGNSDGCRPHRPGGRPSLSGAASRAGVPG